MGSKFSSPFLQKSPLHGAYTSGADAMVTISDAPHYAKLQSDILGGTLAAMEPKVSKCESLRNRWHAKEMSDKAYADASKDCGEEIDKGGLKEGFGGAQTQEGYDYFNDPNIPKGNASKTKQPGTGGMAGSTP